MSEFQIAAKAFIVSPKGQLLLYKKNIEEAWDLPGGVLAQGENPISGLQKLVHEQIGLDIEILLPLDVQHFIGTNGKNTTLLIFLVQSGNTNIDLNGSGAQHEWTSVDENNSDLPKWLMPAIKNYSSIQFNQIVKYIDRGNQM
ncbi:NUDIX hydrolase [Candidatus Uhrbacteria bacterium]|nr:NUDIX hydrolase [Candidatus Uhrbacteria bacterium]